ncbi:MAG: MOSC domain-containing protein [Deltaproteobacteria bacterium]|nr:MOSC domain-containing protein [Deltaproteobacteria bacterium]
MSVVGRVVEVWRYPVKSMGGESLQSAAFGPLGIPGDRGWALRDETAGEIRGAKKMPLLMRCRARYDAEPVEGAAVPPVTMTLADGSTLRSGDADAAARLSALTGRSVTLWPLQPPERADHYRRGLPDDPDMEKELRQVFGRLPDEPLPDFSALPPEIFEYTSPLGTYFDAFPVHLLTTASLRALAAKTPGAQFDVRRFRPNLLIEPGDGADGLVETGWDGRTLRIGGAALQVTMQAMRCSMTTHAVDDLPKDPAVLRTIVRDANQNLGAYAVVTQPGAVRVGDTVEID